MVAATAPGRLGRKVQPDPHICGSSAGSKFALDMTGKRQGEPLGYRPEFQALGAMNAATEDCKYSAAR
jgi:hypothetical protein